MNKKLSIFISWSKSPSQEIALQLKELLENIFTDPNIEIFLSSSNKNGIVAGERFRNKLDNKLMESNFGILVLTNTNYERPWMMFESGALSKNTDESRIVSIVFNRDENTLESPIKNFQYVLYNKEGFRSLIYTIKMSLFGIKELTDKQECQLNNSLSMHWDEFKAKVDAAINDYPTAIVDISDNVTELMMDENAYENILPRRESQLEELINDIHNDSSDRIIIFGGISTILRKEDTIRKFVSWLTVNKESKLFICHENSSVAVRRAEELSENAYSEQVDIHNEIQKRKVIEFQQMKNVFLQLIGNETRKNLHFVELSKTLTNYTTIQGTTFYLTPVLNKRASNTFTFKLKKSKLNIQLIDYIISRTDSDDLEGQQLIKELENIKQEVNAHE